MSVDQSLTEKEREQLALNGKKRSSEPGNPPGLAINSKNPSGQVENYLLDGKELEEYSKDIGLGKTPDNENIHEITRDKFPVDDYSSLGCNKDMTYENTPILDRITNTLNYLVENIQDHKLSDLGMTYLKSQPAWFMHGIAISMLTGSGNTNDYSFIFRSHEHKLVFEKTTTVRMRGCQRSLAPLLKKTLGEVKDAKGRDKFKLIYKRWALFEDEDEFFTVAFQGAENLPMTKSQKVRVDEVNQQIMENAAKRNDAVAEAMRRRAMREGPSYWRQ